MLVHEKRFGDATITFIDADDGDSPRVTRADYERLRELTRNLRTQEEPPSVALSLPMFERILQAIAVELLHDGQ